jgi:hypothetical protein
LINVKTQFRDLLRRKALRCFLTATILFAVFLNFAPVLADGGIAISGSFYQQVFEIPQGSSVSGPSIYVVVFNNGSEDLQVRMTSQAPPGVSAILSQSDFTLLPGGQQEVLVGVEVTQDAVPGEYDISVVAESSKEGITGIQLAGAAAQNARLKVLGESALVTVQSMSLDGQPVVAMVRLYRVVDGQNHEVAYSETGTLETKVAPGSFIAASYMGGEKLAEESFTVAANDKRTVALSGATVYFEGFGVVLNYQKESGKLAFVQLVYAVRNLYQRVDKGEVILEVSRDEAPLDELSLATLSPLEMGRVGLNYNYIPAGGWVDGSYSFKLQLKLNDKPYAASKVEQLKVDSGGEGGGMTPVVIGGIAAAVVVAAGVVWLFVRKRRRV